MPETGDLSEKLTLLLVDKLFIALLIGFATFWLARSLERFKSENQAVLARLQDELARRSREDSLILETELKRRTEAEVRVAEARLPSYCALWSLTKETGRASPAPLDEGGRHELFEAIRDWYYKDGAGAFLTVEARDLLFAAWHFLVERDPDSRPLTTRPDWSDGSAHDQLRQLFSDLRTQLKNDLIVFGRWPDRVKT